MTTWGGQREKRGVITDGWVSAYGVELGMDGQTWTGVHDVQGRQQVFKKRAKFHDNNNNLSICIAFLHRNGTTTLYNTVQSIIQPLSTQI